MNHYLYLTDYEKNLIDSALLILMKKNIQYSDQSKENSVQQYYQDFNLTLFELCAKIKAPDFDKQMDLSSKEIKAIKKALTSLYDRIYQRTLKDIKSNQEGHYKSCKLQIIELERKIDIIEKNNIESNSC
ncbi:hypothetical protein C8D84_101157 [Psychrobacter immobilis]|uniref:Uncharacterized protein n=1 Tax=Psychrobacter immobilis TaxID=498 RepID=A0A2V2A6B9_PSYIM|nr:hypothetical protein C8D84_101157 [Psychrobacter immobilis]